MDHLKDPNKIAVHGISHSFMKSGETVQVQSEDFDSSTGSVSEGSSVRPRQVDSMVPNCNGIMIYMNWRTL
jgi:hypothetical protein